MYVEKAGFLLHQLRRESGRGAGEPVVASSRRTVEVSLPVAVAPHWGLPLPH